MDKKNLSTAVITAILVLIATSLVRDYMDTAEKGDDAQIGSIVDKVIEERMRMTDGKTYGQKLTEISDNQIKTIVRIDTMDKSLGDLEEALKVLSDD